MARTETLLGSTTHDESEIEGLTSQTRKLLESSRDISEQISSSDLRKLSRNGLMAARELEAVLDRLPKDHPLWGIVDELRDELEVFAESVDPETIRYIESGRLDASRNECVPLEQLDS
jgi:Fic family protein